jgi:hypothetical protein
MNKTIALCFLLAASVAIAGEWNEKPVMCASIPETMNIIEEKNEEALLGATQFTKVKEEDGYSDTPAILKMRMFANMDTGTYTIVEWHPAYEQFCVISYGTELNLKGL